MTKRELIEFLTPFDDEIHIVGGPSGRETLMAKYQMSPNGVGTVLLQVTPQPDVEADTKQQCSLCHGTGKMPNYIDVEEFYAED